MEKYRLQYFFYWNRELQNRGKDLLAIHWASDRKDYVAGDFYVRAIQESTDVDRHNRAHFKKSEYMPPMSLEEARAFIDKNREMCGSLLHDCKGLRLEDVCIAIEFSEPIRIRNKQG